MSGSGDRHDWSGGSTSPGFIDRHRRNAHQSKFYKTMRGLSYLHKYGVEFNVLTTINAGNVLNGKGVYRFLRDECVAKYIQFIPIVERIHDSVISNRPNETEGSITAKQYGNFLIEVFEEWVRSDVANVFVQMFDIALASWYGESHGMCVFSPICGTALVMEHNGDIYSCDHFVEPAFKLGNIQVVRLSELLSSHRQLQFGNSKLDLLPAYCLECRFRFACHGGCLKDRFKRTPDGEPGLNYLCAGYKLLFDHVDGPMRLMAKLLREERAPAEIMSMYPWGK